MNKFCAKLCTFYIIDKEKRHEKREQLIINNTLCKKLIMTLLVKDEEDIIEDNLIFHKAMGVDGFIVTDNNSTDNTKAILEKYKKSGWILEIIDEPNETYMQKEWVDRMIRIAKTKYKADWVINADADEFWYSNCINLKESIISELKKNPKINVLYANLKNFVPIENKDVFINSPYFISRGLTPFERNLFNIQNSQYNRETMGKWPKVIHRTHNYVQIAQGNHDVVVKNKHSSYIPSVTIYHYFIRNYKHFENKTIKGGKAYEKHPDKFMGDHWRQWYKEYLNGNLNKIFNNEFCFDKVEILEENGVIQKDTSIANFLSYIKQGKGVFDEKKI